MQPMLFKISAVRSLPNELYLSEKCKGVYVTCKINNQVITTKEFPHSTDIDLKYEIVHYLKRDIDQFRELYEKEPLVLEVHDRDPKNGPVTYYGRADFWLTPLLNRQERELKLTCAIHSVKCKPQPITVPEIVPEEDKNKNKKGGKDDKKKAPPSASAKRGKDDVPEPVQEPQPSLPAPVKEKEEISKGAYIERGSNVKMQILLTDYFPKPSTGDERVPIVIVTRKANVKLIEDIEKFMEEFGPSSEVALTVTSNQENTSSPKSKKKGSRPSSSRGSSKKGSNSTIEVEQEEPKVKKKNDRFTGFELCDGNVRLIVVEATSPDAKALVDFLNARIVEQHELFRIENGRELDDGDVDYVHVTYNPNCKNNKVLYRELVIEEAIRKLKKQIRDQKESERLEQEALLLKKQQEQQLQQQQQPPPQEPPKGKKPSAPPPKKKEEEKPAVEIGKEIQESDIQIDVKEEDLALKPLKRYRFKQSLEEILLDKALYLTDKITTEETIPAPIEKDPPKRSPPTSARSVQKVSLPALSTVPLSKKECLDVVSRLLHLAKALYMKEVLENKLLPSADALRQLNVLFGDDSLIEQDRIDSLEFYEQRQQRLIEERLQQESIRQTQLAEQEELLNRMDTIDDLAHHIGDEMVIVGIPLSVTPSTRHPRAKDCIVQGEKQRIANSKNNSGVSELKYWTFIPSLGGHILIVFPLDCSDLPPFNLVSEIQGILTTAQAESYDGVLFAVYVSSWQQTASSKVDTQIHPRFLRTESDDKDFISANKRRVQQLSEIVTREKPPVESEPIDPNEEVYIYSGQKRRWTERQLQELRLMLKQNPQLKLTYSSKFNSMGISPLSDDELRVEMQMRKLEKIPPPKAVISAPVQQERTPTSPPPLPPTSNVLNKEKSNKKSFDVLCLNKPPGLFPPISSYDVKFDKSDEAHAEELRRREADLWRSKVVVDDTTFHVRASKPVFSDIDRYKGILQDEPKKKSIKELNLRQDPVSIIRGDPDHLNLSQMGTTDKSLGMATEDAGVTVQRAQGPSFYSFNVQKDTLTPDLSHLSTKKISPLKDSERRDDRTRNLFGHQE
jgi:hypothetical protein